MACALHAPATNGRAAPRHRHGHAERANAAPDQTTRRRSHGPSSAPAGRPRAPVARRPCVDCVCSAGRDGSQGAVEPASPTASPRRGGEQDGDRVPAPRVHVGTVMDAMVMPAAATEQSATGLMRAMAPGSVPRPRRRPLYTVLLWWVALLSCLLPVLHVGLVAGLAWLGYAYYAHWAPRGFNGVAMVAWTVPGFMLGVLVLFLLKPFFAPRAKQAEPVGPAQVRSGVRRGDPRAVPGGGRGAAAADLPHPCGQRVGAVQPGAGGSRRRRTHAHHRPAAGRRDERTRAGGRAGPRVRALRAARGNARRAPDPPRQPLARIARLPPRRMGRPPAALER